MLGGSCAAINPLPMVDFIDVFALGAAENLLDELLGALESAADRDAAIDRLADAPGFFAPLHHHSAELHGVDRSTLRRADKRDAVAHDC